MIFYDVIIAGAGPAGLFTAIHAAEEFDRVLILEKQPDPGRKLLLTGSGQCNLTNIRPIREFHKAYGDHGHFLKPALFHFTNQDVIAFFRQHGVEATVVEEDGKVFPTSRRALDILNALLSACRKRNVEIRFREGVIRLEPLAGRGFEVYSATGASAAANVVIATGGKSYPGTGSTGDGYSLARSLGHSLVQPRPGLTPFYMKDFALADLSGISFKNLKTTLWHGGRKLKTLSGDLLLTHKGISGPVVHNLARFAEGGDSVTLSFVPFENAEEFRREWLADLEQHGNFKVKTWFRKHSLPEALSRKIMALAGVDPGEPAAKASREKRLALLRLTTAFPLEIQSLGDFNVAMVTCGGVALEEVNAKTMESRLVKGLYFAGEVLDIDGDSGGYDLQAAWSTAALAAHSMKSNSKSSPQSTRRTQRKRTF
jgi:predicted Rossmann fold flavoprotein